MHYVEPAWWTSDSLGFEKLFGGVEDPLGSEVVATHDEVGVRKSLEVD